MLKLPAIPPFVAPLVEKLPATPPSLLFSIAANRLLWQALGEPKRQQLAGRRYAVRVTDAGLGLCFTVTARGFSAGRGKPDVTFSATARDFLLLLSRREDPDTLFFSRRLVIEGDTELGLTVKNLLDAIDPETVLKRLVEHLPRPLANTARRLLAP
jgi:predicted lipid carrier protein YhbT